MATNATLFRLQLFVQFCADGQNVTRLTAPSFVDFLVFFFPAGAGPVTAL